MTQGISMGAAIAGCAPAVAAASTPPLQSIVAPAPAGGGGCGGNAAAATGFDRQPAEVAGTQGIVPNPATISLANTSPLLDSPATGNDVSLGALGTLTGDQTGVGAPTTPVFTPNAPATTVGTFQTVPGAQAGDDQLVAAAFETLRQSPQGAGLVQQLFASGAHINLLSDQQFAQVGEDGAHAFYDPKADTIYLRRSDLQSNLKLAAIEIAHEGVHLIDDKAHVGAGYLQQKSKEISQFGNTAQGAEALKQAQFEYSLILETRAFTYTGQVARELGYDSGPADPTTIAAAGKNDQATYGKVWQALLDSPYNPEQRTATAANF